MPDRCCSILAAFALTVRLAGCGPVVTPPAPYQPPPVVVTPPAQPPAVRTVAVVVTDGSRPVVGATATLADTDPPGPHTALTDGNGYVAWFGVLASLRNSQLTISAEGYLPYSAHVEVGKGDCRIPPVVLAAVPPSLRPLPRLVPRGQFFALETGARWTGIEASDFNLLNRYLDGEDIEPILHQRAGLGFNLLRVWTLYDLEAAGIGRLLLTDHPDLYARIPAFCDLLAQHGLYVEFTAYTSTWDPQHWGRLGAAVQGKTNVLLELVNEEAIPVNHIDLTLFAPIPGVLCSHGSNGSQDGPVTPYWQYATFHTNGAPEEQRKVGHNSMEIWNGPTITNETSRFPDVGMWARHNDESEPAWLERVRRLACDAAAGAALLAAGSCFHSARGKTSQLWQDAELEAAQAWAAGARSVDLECQRGPYLHRSDLEGSGILRVYERPVAGHACIVKIGR